MTNAHTQTDDRPDWLVPVVVVAVALLLLIAVGVAYALTRSGGEPETFTEELEAYTVCLRDHGANVPIVEDRGDEGFAIVFDGAFLDEGFDPSAVGAAIDECDELVPADLAFLSGLAGGFDTGFLDGLIDGGMLGDELFGHEPGFGEGRDGDLPWGPGPPHFEPGFVPEELCDALEEGGLPSDLPGLERLAELCEEIGA